MLIFCLLETKIYAIKNAWVRHTYVCQNLWQMRCAYWGLNIENMYIIRIMYNHTKILNRSKNIINYQYLWNVTDISKASPRRTENIVNIIMWQKTCLFGHDLVNIKWHKIDIILTFSLEGKGNFIIMRVPERL